MSKKIIEFDIAIIYLDANYRHALSEVIFSGKQIVELLESCSDDMKAAFTSNIIATEELPTYPDTRIFFFKTEERN